MYSLDLVSMLSRLALFASAFFGPLPQGNPDHVIPVEQKVSALVRLARTGNGQACDKIVAAIREKKAESKDTLKGHLETKQAIQVGLFDLVAIANRTKPEDVGYKTRFLAVDSALRNLDAIKSDEVRLNKLIAERMLEEQTFAEVSQRIMALRSKRKQP